MTDKEAELYAELAKELALNLRAYGWIADTKRIGEILWLLGLMPERFKPEDIATPIVALSAEETRRRLGFTEDGH